MTTEMEFYLSPTEVISNAISFVNPLHGAVTKNARESHTRSGRKKLGRGNERARAI